MDRSADTTDSQTRPQGKAGNKSNHLTTALVLPTLNAGPDFIYWLMALREQTVQPDRLLMIDSSSTDETPVLAREFGFEVQSIKREEFSHGGTRQACVDRLEDFDIILFLTQDAYLMAPEAFSRLLSSFEDAKVGAAYGRQLPRKEAGPIEAHARHFNYPRETRVKSAADIPELGFKTAFISNSFAAYRRSVLKEVGGFPSHAILSEDTYVASRMILAGWKVVYVAKAAVYHSHSFSWGQEFRRYFDVGVFHAREMWIRENFGQVGSEGLRFVRSELSYLRRERPTAILSAIIRAGLKLAGYKLGNHERLLPTILKRFLSTNRRYWHNSSAGDTNRP